MLEPLEDRRLLALTDLAAITGTLYYNLLPGNFEQPIANQPVRLYQDGDGDNVFDGAPTDPLKETQLTNAQGEFRFDNLTAGTYFVQQPPEPSGNIHPAPVPIVRTIIVTPADADGDEGVVVDHFEDPQTLVAQLPPAGAPSVSDSIFAPGALGDYRQMDVNAVSGTGQVRVEIDVNNNDVFNYSEEAATAGNATAIWDGTPGVHANVVPTGLGGEDLTGGGVQDSFALLIPISDVPAKQTLTVYTDATHASQTTVDVPSFASNLTQRVMFSSLTQLPGMAGPADFANVGAITFSIIKAPGFPDFGLDYQLHSISTVGPKVLRTTLPFDVTSEIQIVKLTNGTDNNSPTGPVVPVGSTVTFTYIVTNTGDLPLANLVVTDDKGVTVSGPAPGGDSDGDGLLDVNETWTYTASTIAVPGQYVNNGTVAGTPVTETGDPILDVPPVTDEDLEYHFGREKPPIIVLGPEKNPGTRQAVRVVDSNTGEVLSSFAAYEDDYLGGTRVAVADLDGDGTDEIITAPGRNRPPEIRVFTQEGDAVPGFPSFLANSATFMGGTHLTVADVNG
ncbi:MAG: DUF11 domain-containing protein, partial [Pirellulaceae bacterium]|nr:DUF11 domain-containing protein [Pirellulaceae bacterium]